MQDDTITNEYFSTVLNQWLLSSKKNIKESSYARYAFCVSKNILPLLGNYETKALSTDVIERFVEEKLTVSNLAPKTVNDILSVVKLSIKYGKEHGYIFPDSLIIHLVKQHTPAICVLKPYELEKLEKYLIELKTETALGILISIFTGIRIGEVCALKWGDIDFQDNTLSVQRTVLRIQNFTQNTDKKTILVVGSPKTESSYRTIPLMTPLANLLEDYKKTDETYVVSGTNQAKDPRIYYSEYKKILSNLKISGYNYHALRHTFATRCIELGFDVKTLSEILGHSDVNITLRRYVHPSMELKRSCIEKLSFNMHSNT